MVLVPIVLLSLAAQPLAAQPLAAQPHAAQPPPSPAPDFRLSASPDSLVVHRGETGHITIKVEPVAGFHGRVELLSSLLYATTATLSPPSIPEGSGTAILSLTPSAEAIKGEYTVSITGTNDGISHSITVSVTVK